MLRIFKKLTHWLVAIFFIGISLSVSSDRFQRSAPPSEPDFVNSIGMRFMNVPAGTFLMGASPGDSRAQDDERPRHRVTISQSYLLGQFEVTQDQYEAVIGENPSYFQQYGRGRNEIAGLITDNFPVEMVSWFEAVRFCKRLSELPAEKKAGRVYRLPTEAEWEYACRAGTETRYVFGDQTDPQFANYLGDVGRPVPVGTYPPNAFGLYEMHGNVLEWCADWFDATYYRRSPAVDPKGPDISHDDVRVLRGGGWLFTPATSSFRDNISPYLRGPAHGLRVVCELKRSDQP